MIGGLVRLGQGMLLLFYLRIKLGYLWMICL
jgi:hypothetical protein